MLKINPSYPANVAIVTTPPQKNVNKNIKLSKIHLEMTLGEFNCSQIFLVYPITNYKYFTLLHAQYINSF